MNGRDVLKRLRQEGWVLDHVTGSHHLMRKGSLKVPVPVHGSRDLPTGLIKAISRQTGVKLP